MIIISALFIFGIFIYAWRESHSKFFLHINLENPKLNKNFKIIQKELTTSDGLKIHSWYMPVKSPKAVLILIDGYKEINEDKIRMFDHAQYLRKAGYSTLLIDLRSFGKSSGNKITFGVNEWREVEAAFDYMRSLSENKDKKIGFLGISMGGAISIITKGITGKGDFIIASTPYANFKNLFDFQIKKRGLPSFIFLPFARFAASFGLGFNYEYYTAINLIEKVNVPILITSAKNDLVVNPNDAKKIFEKADAPKEYWQANTSHRIFKDNPKEFQKKILDFLSKHI
ncbi:MAG: alpha/beta hydrolase [Candidatus Levybacteria bacterium]|nr:alpha/beta hydrolase [Candidatus Levybacteria bacterium]